MVGVFSFHESAITLYWCSMCMFTSTTMFVMPAIIAISYFVLELLLGVPER